MKFTRELLGRKNQKGIALLLAIFTVVLITYVVMEVQYETNMEYAVNASAINRVKAYYAAKSGADLSLLRIKMYMQVQKQYGKQIPAQFKSYLDMIWSFPFMWPPMLPSEMTKADQESIQDAVKEASMDASYQAFIIDEGSRIDLNDLGSPSKYLRDTTKNLMLEIWKAKMETDDDFRNKNQSFNFEEVVNNIADWVDGDTTSLNGGEERRFYTEDKTGELPPNRGFRTTEELRLVAGVTNDIFDLLKDRVTVYGMKAINPNYATRDVLKSIHSSMNDEVVSQIIQRRDDPQRGGPFKDAGDFWGSVSQFGGQVPQDLQQQIPLAFESAYNFRIRSVGEYRGQTREITAIVYDVAQTAEQIAKRMIEEKQNPNGNPGTGTGASANPSGTGNPSASSSQTSLPKGPPRILYWSEK